MMEITEKGPQQPAHCLSGIGAVVSDVTFDVTDNALLIDLSEVTSASATCLLEEPANDRSVSND